jgi:addiction module HigA family antidote
MLKQFKPNYAAEPGEILYEMLNDYGLTQKDLALRMGRPEKTISEIINGKSRITQETALQLEYIFNMPASFWTNLENTYQEVKARNEQEREIESKISILDKFPLEIFAQKGIIKSKVKTIETYRQLCLFFKVVHLENTITILDNLSYRKHANKKFNEYACASWLRLAENEAEKIECKSFNKDEFSKAIEKIRSLITLEKFPLQEIVDLCSKAGVAVTFYPEIKNSYVCGVKKKLVNGNMAVLLNLYHKTDDHIWFTFFHEAGHILCDDSEKPSVDFSISEETSTKEKKANQFASKILINQAMMTRFIQNGSFTESSIIKFARDINLRPGIIVGQLQYLKILPYNSKLNHLKTSYMWS